MKTTGELFEEYDADNDAYTQCLDTCSADIEVCQKQNAGETFTSAYYESAETQRVAVIWADPTQSMSDTSSKAAVIQQRSVISTGFPARYTVSLYHPPPPEAMFKSGEQSYAFGVVVTFYDRDQDERLDVGTEPIIGFNRAAVFIHNSAHEDGLVATRLVPVIMCSKVRRIAPGFLRRTASPSSESTTMIIWTTPVDQLPTSHVMTSKRVAWLCAPIYRQIATRWSHRQPHSTLRFLFRQWPTVNMSLRRDSDGWVQ